MKAGNFKIKTKFKSQTPGLCLVLLALGLVSELHGLAAPSPAVEIPVAKFTDITREAGLTFVHENGAYGDKLLPETMGGGVAFFDFDNDGFQDLLFINSNYWPGHIPEGKVPPTMAFYRNFGGGRFADVTKDSGLGISAYGMGRPSAIMTTTACPMCLSPRSVAIASSTTKAVENFAR